MNRLARLMGTKRIPELKQQQGDVYEPSQFKIACLTPIALQIAAARHVLQRPAQLKFVVAAQHEMMDDNS